MRVQVLVLGRALVAACVASSGAFAQVRFTETHRLVPTGAALPLSAIGGDFDGDGDRDVVVGDSERDGVGALLVDVGGRFERAACVQAPADFEYGAAGDVDGDGDLDLATTGGLQINQGGCFVDAATLLASSPALGGISVALGDVDGDGDLDIVNGWPEPFGCEEPYPCNGFVALWRNDGAAGFTEASVQVQQLDPQLPSALALADFDGDGDLDLYFSHGAWVGTRDHHLLANDGAGHFTDASAHLPATSSGDWGTSRSLHVADFDGNGAFDVLLGGDDLYLNLGAAQFVLANAGLPGGDSSDVGDYDGDGDLDCVAMSNGELVVLANDGAGVFGVAASAVPSTLATNVELGDYDLDGDLDVFVAGDSFGELVFQGAQGELVVPANDLPSVDIDALDVAVGDVDGDGDNDLYFACSGQDRLYLNDGSGVFASAPLPADSDWSIHCGFVDFDADGDLDVLVGNEDNVAKRLMLNDGHGTFASLAWGPTDGITYDLAPGDVDGDGDLDVVASYAYFANKVFLNDGAGTLTDAPALWPAGYGSTSVELADADQDGDLDALTSDGTLRYYTNDGTGAFTGSAQFSFGSPYALGDIAVGDVDGDGDADAVGATGASLRVFENSGGSFAVHNSAHVAAGGSIELVDLDGDGDLDVLFGYPVEVHLNDGAGDFSDAVNGLPYVEGWAGAAAAGDLDGDFDVDVVSAGHGRAIVLSNLGRHLAWRTPPAIGRALELALDGAPNQAFVLVAASETAHVPLGSVGVLKVKRSALELRRYGQFDAQGRAIVTHDVPADPALAGTSLYWQALVKNPRKLTNLEVTTFVEL